MGAGVSKERLSRASYRARVRFMVELSKLVPIKDIVHKGGITTVNSENRVFRVELRFRVLRATNGEASGWVTAYVQKRCAMGFFAVESLSAAPWEVGGASPQKVANVLRYDDEPAIIAG